MALISFALDDLDEVFVASTARASRAARPPPPSPKAEARAWDVANAAAAAFEIQGLVRVARLPHTVWAKPAPGRAAYRDNRGKHVMTLDAITPARPTAQLSHVFSLQRPIDANAREASHLAYQTVLPLEAAQLAVAGMRSNSVRASVVHKPKKTCGGGQQTTRNNLGDMWASWATQAVSVAVVMGVAKYLCRTQHGLDVSDPAATIALDTWRLVCEDHQHVDPAAKGVFIVTSTTRLLPHAMPTRMTTHSILDTMRVFAQNEIEMGTIRQRVPQQVDALRSICHSIVDKTEGVNVWASWVLLVHMLSDPRLRRMVQSSPINDLEAATAFLFQSYARAEVTRRARMPAASAASADAADAAGSQGKQREKKRKSKPKSDDDDDDDGEDDEGDLNEIPDYEDDAASLRSAMLGSPSVRMAKVVAVVATDVARRNAADHQTLSLKRKRPPLSGPTHSISGGFLEYWQAALHSEYASILKMMITQSKSLASSAAADTLCGQAPEGIRVHTNPVLMDISGRNAVRSAEAISSLVVTSDTRVPKILTWRCRNKHNNIVQCHVGMVRSVNDASNTTLHACKLAPKRCQPLHGTANHTVCVWSYGVRNTTPRDQPTTLLPGVMEGAQHLHALGTGQIRFQSRHQLAKVFDQVKQKAARAASDGSLPLALTGIVRGVIVLRGSFVFALSPVRTGVQVATAMALALKQAGAYGAFEPASDFESCALLSQESFDPKAFAEPYATPSNNIALGLQANEKLRLLMKNRSHCGGPCRHLCGVVTPQELQEPSVEELDKPQSVLPIVDCKIDMLEDPTSPGEALPNRRDACLRKAAVTLTVCGDAPVRLPELLDLFCQECGRLEALLSPRTTVLAAFYQLMSLTFGGAARASEVNDLATSICAGHVNSSIASAKRILVGDLNLRPLLTLYDVYRVGTCNVPRSYETTVWSGCYGASFDIGTSGGVGTNGSAATADKRNHGKLLMSQAQVDRWCDAFSNVHYMKVSNTEYAPIPREVRGVPHYTVPGLHAYLDDYENGLERARALLGVEGHSTVDSLQCLSFGAYSERQAPHVSEGADPTTSRRFRNAEDAVHADGRAFQIDATCADVSIFREPLVPNVAITAPQDNIFAQSMPFVTTAFGAAAVIARQARTTFRLANPDLGLEVTRPREEVQLLHKLLCAFHLGSELPTDRCNHYIAATACVMLNVIFPATHEMACGVVFEAYARAPAACAIRVGEQLEAGQPPIGAGLPHLGLPAEAVEEAQRFWAAFERKNSSLNAWHKLEPLLLKLLENNGSFDNSLDSLDAVWRANDQLLRAATWMVASPDGCQAPLPPSPLAGVRSWTQVRSEHINPIFVGYTNAQGKNVAARASLIGIMPMGFQQILALLMAAPSVKNVTVQYAHNFGYLIYRPSAAPDILTSKNRERSSKAISCVNVEGDEAAFGTREEKMKMCKLHRLAWRTNLDVVLPLCTTIAPPRSDARRARGDRAAVDYIKERKRDLDAAGMRTKQEHEAAALFHQAVLDAQLRP